MDSQIQKPRLYSLATQKLEQVSLKSNDYIVSLTENV